MEDPVGDTELAEVVEHTGGVDSLHPVWGKPERQRCRARAAPHRPRVLRGACVAHVERLGQQHHRRQAKLLGLGVGGLGVALHLL